jgi:hypothetical protein
MCNNELFISLCIHNREPFYATSYPSPLLRMMYILTVETEKGPIMEVSSPGSITVFTSEILYNEATRLFGWLSPIPTKNSKRSQIYSVGPSSSRSQPSYRADHQFKRSRSRKDAVGDAGRLQISPSRSGQSMQRDLNTTDGSGPECEVGPVRRAHRRVASLSFAGQNALRRHRPDRAC